MAKKDNQYYALGLVALIIVGGIWLYNSKHSAPKSQDNNNPQGQNSQNQSPTPTPSGVTTDNVWKGTLQISDNQAKGNLMLVTEDRNIYMRTSRDFSSLIGKNVNVSYSGTLDSFSLGSITAQ